MICSSSFANLGSGISSPTDVCITTILVVYVQDLFSGRPLGWSEMLHIGGSRRVSAAFCPTDNRGVLFSGFVAILFSACCRLWPNDEAFGLLPKAIVAHMGAC